jgi:hypothetical protein
MRRRDDFIESEAARQVRLREAQLMREAAAEQRICRRCGAPLEEGYDVICMKCDYDDWHEEIPEIFAGGGRR